MRSKPVPSHPSRVYPLPTSDYDVCILFSSISILMCMFYILNIRNGSCIFGLQVGAEGFCMSTCSYFWTLRYWNSARVWMRAATLITSFVKVFNQTLFLEKEVDPNTKLPPNFATLSFWYFQDYYIKTLEPGWWKHSLSLCIKYFIFHFFFFLSSESSFFPHNSLDVSKRDFR